MKVYQYVMLVMLVFLFGCQDHGLNQLSSQINIMYVENDTADHVNHNFYVPLEVNGVTIIWESHHENVTFEQDRGLITKTLENQTITITATYNYKNKTHKKQFNLVIMKADESANPVYDFSPIIEKIVIPARTDKDIDLPRLIDGVTAVWESQDITSLTNDGKIIRKDEDVTVILSVTLSIDGFSTTHQYNILIEKLVVEPEVINFYGVQNITYTIGEDVPNYLVGITARSNYDIDYTNQLRTNLSLINLEEPGIYTVTVYLAFDPTIKTTYTIEVIEPEVINFYGVQDITYMIGDDAPDYLDGIYAISNHGVDYTADLEANASLVNLTSPGIYTVDVYLIFDINIKTTYTVTVKNKPGNFTGYYESLAGLSGQALMDALTVLLNDTQTYETTTYGEARYILEESDVWVGYNTEYVNVIYTDTLRGSLSSGFPFDGYALPIWDANGDGTNSTWNREHVWAKSLFGTGNYKPSDSTRGIVSDMHNLRAADTNVNSARGNNKFINQISVSGGFGNYDGMWYPGDTHRGDVARILFYMDIRWGNQAVLSNIGDLPTLMAWHELDPVDAFELHRNEVIYSYQKNRNPFIDHPELVELIYNPSYQSFDIPRTLIQTMLSSYSTYLS